MVVTLLQCNRNKFTLGPISQRHTSDSERKSQQCSAEIMEIISYSCNDHTKTSQAPQQSRQCHYRKESNHENRLNHRHNTTPPALHSCRNVHSTMLNTTTTGARTSLHGKPTQSKEMQSRFTLISKTANLRTTGQTTSYNGIQNTNYITVVTIRTRRNKNCIVAVAPNGRTKQRQNQRRRLRLHF